MPGAQDVGIVAPYSEKVNNCPKVTQLVNDMSVIWYLVYIIPVLLSPIVLPCPKFLWWSKYRTMIPFCKEAKREHASWELRASITAQVAPCVYDLLWATAQNHTTEQWTRIWEPRSTFLPTSRLLGKKHLLSPSVVPFLEATFWTGQNSLIESHYYVETHCQFNERIRKKVHNNCKNISFQRTKMRLIKHMHLSIGRTLQHSFV